MRLNPDFVADCQERDVMGEPNPGGWDDVPWTTNILGTVTLECGHNVTLLRKHADDPELWCWTCRRYKERVDEE